MPREIRGFYYDAEKNRYFPIKGPIPGSASSSSSSHRPKKPTPPQSQENPNRNTTRRKETKTTKLLQLRELYGNMLSYNSSKCNFQHEYQKNQAAQSMIWKYKCTERIAEGALGHIHVDMQTTEGQTKVNFLLKGRVGGSLILYEVKQIGEHFDYGVEYMPDPIWPSIRYNQGVYMKVPKLISIPGDEFHMNSTISSIKAGRRSLLTDDTGSSIRQALITTMGSEASGGSIYIMDISESLVGGSRGIFEVASLNCTIWTADCYPDLSQAVVGTNRGAALLNVETGAISWLCHSKSDIFSQQFNQSGNAALCGFRNGAIVTVDVREKQQRYQIPFSSNIGNQHSSKLAQKRAKGWFKLKGSIHPSSTIFMPSSISSLISLRTDEQYFLASSMDGSIKLYDHRLIQRGAVQSYEGHVNSHTRIQMGVDPSERIMISGGEDGKVRIWSIKTGELLFGTKISDSALTTVCCPGSGILGETSGLNHNYGESLFKQNHTWGSWLGSADDLFYLHSS